jgi:hypothetical protein
MIMNGDESKGNWKERVVSCFKVGVERQWVSDGIQTGYLKRITASSARPVLGVNELIKQTP